MIVNSNFWGSLFTNLILRDLLGKILPGLVVVTTTGILPFFSSYNVLSKFDSGRVIWQIVLIVCFSWLMGLIIQGVGMLFRLIRFYPSPKKLEEEDEEEGLAEWDKSYVAEKQQTAAQIGRIASERMVALKRASGNASIAALLSAYAREVTFCLEQGYMGVFSDIWILVLFVLFIVFLYMHL